MFNQEFPYAALDKFLTTHEEEEGCEACTCEDGLVGSTINPDENEACDCNCHTTKDEADSLAAEDAIDYAKGA